MKRILSFVLILVLALGLLAGCGNQPANSGATGAGLEDAKAYLHAMYKEEAEITAVDYSRVGVVMIDGVSYTVTWTADNEAIKITANDKTYKVELPDTLEDISYTLTATISDAAGNTETLTFTRMIPAAAGLSTSIEDGTYVILACGNLTMSSLTEDKSYGYPYATEVTVAGGTVSGHKIADVLTIKNVDGGVTIQDAYGRYFYLKGTYNSFNVDAEAPAEGHVWEILKNGDNYLVVNAMNKKTLAYDSGYTSWGAYPELGDTHNYLLSIVPATAPAEDPTPDEPVVNNDPAADSTLSIADAIALGASKEHNTYTEGKYYVTGVITEVYSEQYGNMYITDDAGNILTIYGTYDADGTNRYDAMATKPVAGDTVTIYGIIGQYNGTAQIKNGWITAHTAAGGNTEPETPAEPETPDEPVTPSVDPVADSTLSVADAIALGASKEHNTYTEGKYYVTGVITEVYNTQYGNMRITDEAGNILTVYGTYDADGTNRYDAMATQPVAGDTVTIYGIIGQYNDAPQIKNGWITAHTPGTAPETPTEPETPAASTDPIVGDMTVKIYYAAEDKYASDKPADRNRLAGVSEAEATVWTVVIDENGYYIFVSEGKYMTSGETGNSMSMESTLTDCARWEVIACDGGVYLRNVGANYNGNYNQYMEFYYDFTTYGFKEDNTGIYTFQLVEVK